MDRLSDYDSDYPCSNRGEGANGRMAEPGLMHLT